LGRKRYSESRVELLARLDRRLEGEVAHSDRELIEKAVLSEHHGKGRSPVINKSDLSWPLDILLVGSTGSEQADAEVRESNLDSRSADAQIQNAA
jgi:hypothetical protein